MRRDAFGQMRNAGLKFRVKIGFQGQEEGFRVL